MAVHDGYGLIKTSVTLPFGGESLSRLFLRDLVVNHKLEKIPLRYQIQMDSEVTNVLKIRGENIF